MFKAFTRPVVKAVDGVKARVCALATEFMHRQRDVHESVTAPLTDLVVASPTTKIVTAIIVVAELAQCTPKGVLKAGIVAAVYCGAKPLSHLLSAGAAATGMVDDRAHRVGEWLRAKATKASATANPPSP
jgi:hypothetical protein